MYMKILKWKYIYCGFWFFYRRVVCDSLGDFNDIYLYESVIMSYEWTIFVHLLIIMLEISASFRMKTLSFNVDKFRTWRRSSFETSFQICLNFKHRLNIWMQFKEKILRKFGSCTSNTPWSELQQLLHQYVVSNYAATRQQCLEVKYFGAFKYMYLI